MIVKGLIFDIDGVVVDSPHETAWGDTLRALMQSEWADIAEMTGYQPESYTSEIYQTFVSGKTRIEGARSLLAALRISDPDGKRAERLCKVKQEIIAQRISRGEFAVYEDARRLIGAALAKGLKLAAASSSQNAKAMLEKITISGLKEVGNRQPLISCFHSNVCGGEGIPSKPHPGLFLRASALLGISPGFCAVIEDAPSGIQAARSAAMFAIGIARRGDADLLRGAGANLVVESLDAFHPWVEDPGS